MYKKEINGNVILYQNTHYFTYAFKSEIAENNCIQNQSECNSPSNETNSLSLLPDDGHYVEDCGEYNLVRFDK